MSTCTSHVPIWGKPQFCTRRKGCHAFNPQPNTRRTHPLAWEEALDPPSSGHRLARPVRASSRPGKVFVICFGGDAITPGLAAIERAVPSDLKPNEIKARVQNTLPSAGLPPMMYLADLSGLIFLTAAGMMYATWKLYRGPEASHEDSGRILEESSREHDEVTTSSLQL